MDEIISKKLNGEVFIEDFKCTAVNKLLSHAKPNVYKASINEMWEAWLTHENTNETDHRGRESMLMIYKNLIEFFNRV